jgi:hypothetical protein
MPTEIILQQSPDDLALLDKRRQLAAMRTTLAERESDLADLRARLRAFESRYFHQVGTLYAELDEIDARIVEREADLYDSDEARQRAQEARRRAEESHAAAYDIANEPEEFDPPPNLKSLFRELARRIHPDFARDPSEQQHFTRLMARANQAYKRGDIETLERLLDDHREVNAIIGGARSGEDSAAELLRINRQLLHAQRDLAALDREERSLLASDIGQLSHDAESAALEHRDLLAELAAGLSEQIAEANRRLEFTLRQVDAHGR